MMATSGLVCRIHSCDFSKPENTLFQYGSSVLLLSSAAPMAGTCDEPIPAMILATASLPFLRFRFGLAGFRFGLRLGGARIPSCRGGEEFRWRVFARSRPIALNRTAAAEHHLGVIVLGVAGHHRGEMLERMAVGGAELGGEIDIAAELQHAVVIALEYRLGLLRRELELFEVVGFVRLEGFAVVVLHQRHAEHIDAEPLPGPFGVEHKSARNIVVIVLFASH